MKANEFKWGQGFIVLITSFVLFESFYLQYVEGLQLCPLCFMQRSMAVALLFFALLGLVSSSTFQKRGVLCIELFEAGLGVFFALRQLWLQSLPMPETGMCLPGIEALVERLPWHEVIHAFVWGGKTSCGEVVWDFLGLSMASWSLLYFGFMTLLCLFLLVRLKRNEHL